MNTGIRTYPGRIRQAFTLIEILASILLFSMGVMSIIVVITYGMKSAAKAQIEATAWSTAMTALKDPLPLGSIFDPAAGTLRRWQWSASGNTWMANEPGGSGDAVWRYTIWSTDQQADILAPDMGDPVANNPAVFPPGGSPLAGCANGWLNGYYVERREQSRGTDRIGQGVRLVEVRVDVYWAGYIGGDGRPLASLVDRYIRQEAP
jgi:type II secretory pathway pseudopilin PulG